MWGCIPILLVFTFLTMHEQILHLPWLNTTATIKLMSIIDVATIQGWPLIEGDICNYSEYQIKTKKTIVLRRANFVLAQCGSKGTQKQTADISKVWPPISQIRTTSALS